MNEKKPTWGSKTKPLSGQKRVDVSAFEIETGVLREVDKNSIFPDPTQPRQIFSDEAMTELKESIEENGLLQPILVIEDAKEDGIGKYRIIAGERRWRAAMSSEKIRRLQVVIRNDISDELKILLAQIAENVHRENMTIIETAESYKRVLDAVDGDTEKAVKLLNVSKTRFSTTMGLNKADEKVRELAKEGVTKDVDALAGLNVLASLNEEKANDVIVKIRDGEISKTGIRKTVSDLVKEEKKARKQNKTAKAEAEAEAEIKLTVVENDSVATQHREDIQAENETIERVYSVELNGGLMEELVDFLKEKENSDDYFLIKKVLLALKNAKKLGEQ
jgi:ParB family chromosome partitioning protein